MNRIAFWLTVAAGKWLYVSNLSGKKIKRVYLGEVGTRLPVGS